MKPAPYDLKVTRGDDYVLPINVRGRDALGNKTVLDLTGYTLESKVILPDGTLVTVSTNWLAQATGQLELFVSRSVTAVFPITSGGKWYFALVDPSGRKTSYMDGALYVRDHGDRQR